MKRTALCLALTCLVGLAFAPGVRADDVRADRWDIHKDVRDLRSDRRAAAVERGDLWRDRRDIRHDLWTGNRWDLRRDLRDVHHDVRELHAIRFDARRDIRDIRHDRRGLWRDRWGRCGR